MSAEAPGFREIQAQMTAWLRNPAGCVPPDVEQRRLDVYRELLFNNVRDFVETAYPVLKSLLPESGWQELVRRYFALHHARSPYFRDISLEFREWVQASEADWLARQPWVQELMHFEWMELAADCAEVGEAPACQPAGDLLAGVPCARPALWPLVYRWPVHRFSPANPPEREPPEQATCLLAYRDDDDMLHFMEVSPLSARLVEMIQSGEPRSGAELLASLAREAGLTREAEQQTFLANGRQLLEALRQHGILLGTCLVPV